MTATLTRRETILDVDPDGPFPVPRAPILALVDGFPVYSPFVESDLLAEIGAGLIDRNPRRYEMLAKLPIAYLFAPGLGKLNGAPRLWRLRRADDWTKWALGQLTPPRFVDLFVCLNSHIVRVVPLTHWQVQATVHTALSCVRVRDGQPQVLPCGVGTEAYIIRRYGPDWRPDLAILQEAMKAAQEEQLPLWEEEEDEDEQ